MRIPQKFRQGIIVKMRKAFFSQSTQQGAQIVKKGRSPGFPQMCGHGSAFLPDAQADQRRHEVLLPIAQRAAVIEQIIQRRNRAVPGL
ncbi:hypothetical protein SDC9_168719 [bioreactor metagenome]|uniref:Uncharacterized protein n=1 Tax=bioreactor metagenome TaxID=1076179 RepID=A0A645G5X9_9ZZZZ